MKTAINHSEIADGLKAKLQTLEAAYDEALELWRKSGDFEHRSDDLWQKCSDINRDIEPMKRELQFHEIMMQEQAYATEWLWSDAHAYEVIEEKSEKVMLVRRMKATLKESAKEALHESFVPGGFFGHFNNDLQEWDFESDESNGIETIRKHKDGRWYNRSGMHFTIDAKPYERYDYNF